METTNKQKILIIEDSASSRALLVKHIQSGGYEALAASLGQEGITLAVEHKPDLILLDILMPEMDGFACCEILKNQAETKAIPVIFLTGEKDTETLKRAFRLGGCDYLTKPYDKLELLKRIADQLKLVEDQCLIQEQESRIEQALHSMERLQLNLFQKSNLRMICQLVAGVADELNTPLSVVHTADSLIPEKIQRLQALKEQVKDDLSKQALNTLVDELQQTHDVLSKNIKRIVKTVDAFKSLSLKEIEDNFEWLSLHEFLSAVTVLLEVTLADKQSSVSIACAKDIQVYTVSQALLQVVIEIIMNALEHGYPTSGGEIAISVAQNEQETAIRFTDQGVGIPETLLDEIFRPFVKAQPNKQGIGLGLHMIQSLLEQKLNGKIEIQSTVNKGTTVTVHLFAEQEQHPK